MTPRAVSALLGSQPSAEHDRRDQRQAQRRQHRADEPADAAGQRHPAEHDGGHAVERGVGADRGAGLTAAGRRRDDEAGEAGEEPADRVGERPGSWRSSDAGQEGGLAVAADGVDGETEAAAPQRKPHQQQRPDSPQDRRPGVGQPAGDELLEVRRRCRRRDAPITNSASPASMKLAASVTMMSGTPETVMITPGHRRQDHGDASTPTAIASRRPGPGPPSTSADRQLASTIIAPTDRSMPPEITITAWAMARKARRHRAGGDRADLEVAELRAAARRATAAARTSSSADPDRPALTPGEARQPARGCGQARGAPPSSSGATGSSRRAARRQAVGGGEQRRSRRRRRAARRRCGRCGARPPGRRRAPISRSSLVNITMAAPSSASARTRS